MAGIGGSVDRFVEVQCPSVVERHYRAWNIDCGELGRLQELVRDEHVDVDKDLLADIERSCDCSAPER